jgi:DNA polymerase III sliding clamp (beta) subunit (PCNA family)
MTRESNVFQMWPERENVDRGFVRSDNIRRVVPPSVLSRHLGDDPEVVNLYQSLEDQARIAEIVAEIDAADAPVRGFNCKYLGSFGEHLSISGNGAAEPHLIRDCDDPEFVGVLMPMRADAPKVPNWIGLIREAVKQAA